MKQIPVLGVIVCRSLPSKCCPACGKLGPPTSDGLTPITRLSCSCGWFARYQLRPAEERAR